MEIVEYTNVLVCRQPQNSISNQYSLLFLANNLVGFGSEWTLKLSVRCKFESDRNLDQSLLPISSSSVYLLSTWSRSSYRFSSWCLCGMLCLRLSCTENHVWITSHLFACAKLNFFSWRKERSAGLPNMKYDTDIWNSQKYLIEATIPEMSICTDCILSRLTIINVEPADLGHYYINATSPDFPPEYGKITLYRKRFFREAKNKYI